MATAAGLENSTNPECSSSESVSESVASDVPRPKDGLVSCPAPSNAKKREGVWTNVYRARVARAEKTARQSGSRIKSHDVKNAINSYCLMVCVCDDRDCGADQALERAHQE